MKIKLRAGLRFMMGVVLLMLFLLPSVSALCAVEFVNYHGSCGEDGDLRVVDAQGEVVAEQYYTVNRACYHGKYLIAVPGGSGTDCRVTGGDELRFQIGGVTMGSTSWSNAEKVVTLDLVRPSFKPARGDVLSPNLLYFILTVMALVLVIVSIFAFYRRKK